MRKVTGYIGALIVVVALMGSILAGYALNVNGQSVVVNEYENVTDVSGLYSHTDEKTYIDYNPASNYIGYSEPPGTFTNEVQNPNYRFTNLTKGTVFIAAGSGINVNNGGYYWSDTGTDVWKVVGEGFFIFGSISAPTITGAGFQWVGISSMLIDVDLPTVTFTWFELSDPSTQHSKTVYDMDYILAYDPVNYDYVGSKTTDPDVNRQIYLNDTNQVYGLALSTTINDNWGSFHNTAWVSTEGVTSTIQPITLSADLGQNIKDYTINTTVSGYDRVLTIYPHTVKSTGSLGIDYTESNRVNNYPIEYIYQENTEIQTLPQIDLISISATSYFPYGYSWVIHENITRNMTFTYDGTTFSQWQGVNLATDQAGTPDNMKYRLSDIIATMDVPVGTSQLIFDTGTYAGRELILSDTISGVTSTGLYIPSNMVAIGTESYINGNTRMTGSDYGTKAFYTISTGLVDTYNRDGVKLSTSSLNDTYVQFYDEPNLTGDGFYQKALDPYGINRTVNIVFHWTASPGNSANNPYLNVTAVTNGAVENIKYLDVTKGIKIDPANISDVVWNNEYENGNIQLLFRADDVGGIYHNDLEVSGNSISVDYGDSRFSVTLNGGEPVNIGTWRSIILDIDLENGDLYAIPVRTFNSFTNVQMDNTSLFIGSMTDYATTNTIEWNPTPNSLTFSVYNTSVFMNTYGVVMVDPSLTVTEYFTDLNNFYRLELTNFSIYGDSMTINGEVGEVTGNRITFGDESLIIKKLYITYADGNVYLSDGSTNIDLGEITSNNIIFGGAWYFKTFLQKGHTAQKQVYTWDWQNFILDNTEFCVIYIGLVLAGLVVARRFCTFTIMDYVVMGISLIIALGVQVIA